MKDELMRT